MVVYYPRLYLHVPQHCINVLFCVAIMEFFLASIYPKFNFTGLIEAPSTVQHECLTVHICGLRAQDHEPVPRIEKLGSEFSIAKVFDLTRSHLKDSLILKIVTLKVPIGVNLDSGGIDISLEFLILHARMVLILPPEHKYQLSPHSRVLDIVYILWTITICVKCKRSIPNRIIPIIKHLIENIRDVKRKEKSNVDREKAAHNRIMCRALFIEIQFNRMTEHVNIFHCLADLGFKFFHFVIFK